MEHFKLYVLLDGSAPVDSDFENENLLKNSGTLHKFNETLPTGAVHHDGVERLNHEWGRNLLLKSDETATPQGVSVRWSDLQERTWGEI